MLSDKTTVYTPCSGVAILTAVQRGAEAAEENPGGGENPGLI